MSSRSCGNLFDFGSSGGFMDLPHTPSSLLPRVMRVITDADSDTSSPGYRRRNIIVANMLPLLSQWDQRTNKWQFNLDEDSILLQMRDGLGPEAEVVYVGSLKVEIKPAEQEEVAQRLLEEFKCVPTFVPPEVHKRFYYGFCKQQLWPLFHYMLPMWPGHGDRFDRQLWQAYVSANKTFADRVMEVLVNPEEDFVWVHDYHLMVLPTFLRRRYYRIKLGFFLHSPFPSSEIYRTLPVRDEIIKGLLNADLIGFHTFDYARHFLSCCSRMLGLGYESKRGHICLDYFGRTIYVKILPVGIHVERLESVMQLPSTGKKAIELQKKFEGKHVILGIDDMDIFKGISLKLLAFERLLKNHPCLAHKVVLVQIVNPARGSGKDVQEAKRETYAAVRRINEIYGCDYFEPVVLIDRHVPRHEKTAYYAVAEVCIVNAVRDGMNLVPYKYIVCRQGSTCLDEAMGTKQDSPRTSMLIVSEFVGCSPSLSGAIRVNPWDIDAVGEAMNSAITLREREKQLRHEKHYRYVSSHDLAYWARSFMQDLEMACREHYDKRCWGMGLGLGFRVIALSPHFRKLSVESIVSAYKRTSKRAIFLDYDGTVVSQFSMDRSPSTEVVNALNSLCADPKNTVFIVSGRGRTSLNNWLSPCEKLGIAAEHGYFLRWDENSEWEALSSDVGWKAIVEPIMKLYTEATDGSYVETKESALVWHHQHADPDFGSCQAKELLNHLENVLANEPAVVRRGHAIVEVKPQGVTKGTVAEKVLSKLVNHGKAPDFVLCVGDDRSDEDMFESISNTISGKSLPSVTELFACTVGQKPSKAKYYLDDTSGVVRLLCGLANASNPKPGVVAGEQQLQVAAAAAAAAAFNGSMFY